MHKRKIRRIFVRLRPLSYWYFVLMLLVSGGVALYALRQNNLRALELRDKVLDVDKQDGDIETALRELREFTYGHMNARLSSDTGIYPPIQLKYRYERLTAAEKRRTESANQDVYAQAQRDCERRFPSYQSGNSRRSCIASYVDNRNKTQSPEPQAIPDAMYKFDFVAPIWSPDLAGWSLVVAATSLVLLATRIAAGFWLKHQLED